MPPMRAIDIAIEALIFASTDEPDPVCAPSEQEIAATEQALGKPLPPDFKFFMERCGIYQLEDWQTYWVGDDSLAFRNIVDANMEARKHTDAPLPAFLIAFHQNDMGDEICFDTRDPDEQGEYPVVVWDYGFSPEQNLANLTVLASHFADWLQREVHQAS